ncbi:type II toxin-antitoxin system RelE/ParE family toxin [Duganella vulcania]|uniref:Type II toxin-antitoxin system RelE/ParE family toxin n=1 Tax=Duganella vulcania TaxID=2692166 RepID=A0A845GIK5_9BURK|nr:type II toxin-antitoxin system RelE/ParE family toxin [Duganella vulcania]
MASGNAGSGSLRVRWLPSARKAYSRSIVYIAEQDRRAADLVAERVEKALDMIALQPGMGTPVSRLGRRRFPIPRTGHVIEYYVANDEVRVTRWARQTRKS